MQTIDFISAHPSLNFAAYLAYCLVGWALSLYLYEKATPCSEWEMVAQGNKAAAWSMGGVAIGLALPLAALALRADNWTQMGGWSIASLAVQLGVWFVLGHTVFSKLKASMEAGVESVGMMLGFCAVSIGLLIAACVA